MSGLLIPNTTMVPNVLLDKVMPRLKESSLRVLLAVIRKTYGFRKQSDRISLSQLQRITGLSRQGVVDGIEGLGTLLKVKRGAKQPNEYSLNLDVSTGQLVNGVDQSMNLTSQLDPKKPGLTSQRSRQTKQKRKKYKTNNGAFRKKRESAAPPSDSRPGKNAPTPDPRVKTVLDTFAAKYRDRTDSPYVVVRGKDPTLLKNLFSAGHDEASIEPMIDRYFNDPFYCKHGFDVGGFVNAFNRLKSAGSEREHDWSWLERDLYPSCQPRAT